MLATLEGLPEAAEGCVRQIAVDLYMRLMDRSNTNLPITRESFIEHSVLFRCVIND